MKIRLQKTAFAIILILLPLIALVRAKSPNNTNPPTQSNSVPMFGGNAQHTSIYQPTAQTLNNIRWTTTIDLNPGDLAHYGAPLITAANTVLVSVKTATDGFRVDAFDGPTGTAKYTLTTDYTLPSHGWVPVYNPCLTTGSFGTRLYYPGRGGTIYYIDNPDDIAHGTPVHQVFYTTLANYLANATAYNNSIFINTPITADSHGNIFFGFRVSGTAPSPISSSQSGFARIDPNGNGTYILTAAAAGGDTTINRDSHNSAPALSNDESLVYVVAKNNMSGHGYLLALDSTTLAMRHRVQVMDPRNGKPAVISDDSTASPTVAPDNDVYIGILSNPGNGSRGFLLRFTGDLSVEKTPGGFGWDYTCAIVPASMVPSYKGNSTYLIFSKYNNYAGFGDGDGVNRIALLDPNDTQIDPHSSADGLVEMREVLSVIGATPDVNAIGVEFPYAVREWCINTAAVNPATNSVFTPSEDGHIYRWDLATNSLSQAVELTEGFGEPYVPTVIGPDGVVYTLNGGTLFALGALNGVDIALTSSVPDVRPVVVGDSLTFTAVVTNTGPSGVIPTGTITFKDFTYQDITPVTTTLGMVTLDGSGHASLTTSSLTAGNGFLGNHYITASYSGDGTFTHGDAVLVQKVHASASATTLGSSPNPSGSGQPVTFTATVVPTPAGSIVPTGQVTFQEGTTVIAQVPLDSSGHASFTTSTLSDGNHTITASYYSDTMFASSSGMTTQIVGTGGPTPTPTATATPTPSGTPTPSPTLTPSPTPPGISQPINLSTRLRVQTGDNVGIGGFIVTGTEPKQVLIRGIGPSLGGSGVPDPLADPFLSLEPIPPGGQQPVTNDNWKDTQQAAIEATGLAPTNDLESAILVTLNPGAYTTILSGKNNTTGIALVEVYDLGQAAASKLANISTRGFVDTGNDVMIAGFILGGHTDADRVIVRGIGPSLTAAGVPNALADPMIEIRDGNGVVLVSNNNWQDDPTAGELMAAGLAPTNDLESGLATTLAPGAYTALLSGVSNGVGVGLVEVYDRGGPLNR